jgi:hypothetical protein
VVWAPLFLSLSRLFVSAKGFLRISRRQIMEERGDRNATLANAYFSNRPWLCTEG